MSTSNEDLLKKLESQKSPDAVLAEKLSPADMERVKAIRLRAGKSDEAFVARVVKTLGDAEYCDGDGKTQSLVDYFVDQISTGTDPKTAVPAALDSLLQEFTNARKPQLTGHQMLGLPTTGYDAIEPAPSPHLAGLQARLRDKNYQLSGRDNLSLPNGGFDAQ